jgi:uncharacterized protein YbbK (DUF523 family)/uncharacterized protein YbgA (DUF1722 family)
MGSVRVGISSCLLGEQVRYDGGHKRDAFLTEALGRHVEFVPLCPEVEIGLGVPRPTLHLARRGEEVRMVVSDSGEDLTERMRPWARAAAERIARAELDGYVLKRSSPSCGMERVKVYDENGVPSRSGRGLFAEALLERLPLLPVEEEGRLRDARLREHFVARVFAHARVREFLSADWTPGDLVGFHSREKMLVRVHDPGLASELGRLVAEAGELDRTELAERYAELHARALAKPATPGRHQDVLEHLAGHVKDEVSSADRAELQTAIEEYREGIVPLAVPLALLRRHIRAASADWAAAQVYLEPAPRGLGLRSRL